MRRVLISFLAVLTALGLACDSGNPVAPGEGGGGGGGGGGGTGTYTITISASPDQLLAGGSEPSTLTITVRQAADNQSPADGTVITVSVDSGSLGSNDPANPITLQQLSLAGGQARTTLFPAAEPATANVLAQLGESVGRATVAYLDALPNDFFISSVQPNVGRPQGGDRISIQGGGFKEPLRVLIGGAAAQLVDVPSTSTILVDTPASTVEVLPGASVAADVTVQNDLTSTTPPVDTLAGAFFYRENPEPTAPPAFLTEVEPDTGPAEGGTRVIVRGGGFREPLRLSIGETNAEVIEVRNQQITAITPPSATPVEAGALLPVNVLVESSLDFASPATAVLFGGFTYDGGEVPEPPEPVVVSAISPASGPYTGGTEVTVSGSGFASPVAVELGGVRQGGETVVSSTEVRFTTAALQVAECPASGSVPVTGVTVTNLDNGESGTAGLTFTYTLPQPRITRISPTSGTQLGNTVVTIEGEGFEAPVRVVFAKDGREFAGVVQGEVTETRVRVSTPRVPDDLFPEVDCVTEDDEQGKRYVAVTVDVKVTQQTTGCVDTFPNSYTYQPSFPQCRAVAPP